MRKPLQDPNNPLGRGLTQVFDVDWHGAPFILFGTAHVVALATIAVAIWALSFLRNSSPGTKRAIRVCLVVVLWAFEIVWHVWQWRIGQWDIQRALPLALCSMFVWACGIMLLTRSRWIYDVAYFLGVGGALQALATPDLGPYGFPHYRFLLFMASHGLIVASVAWMTYAEGCRPTRRSLLKAIVVGNALALVVMGVNALIGSNYMFLSRKPDAASVLDLLPPWPWYLPWIEVIAVVMFVLLYAPWDIADRVKARRLNREPSGGPAR